MIEHPLRPAIIAVFLLLLCACAGTTTQNEAAAAGHSRLRPGDQTRYETALSQMSKGKLPEARQTLASLALRYEDNREIQLNLATAFYLTGDPDAADATLTAPALDQLAHYHNLRGLIAVQRGDYQVAKQHYQRALKQDEQHAHSHYNLALLYDVFYQDLAAARPHYQRYLELIGTEDSETTAWLRQIDAALARGEGR